MSIDGPKSIYVVSFNEHDHYQMYAYPPVYSELYFVQ